MEAKEALAEAQAGAIAAIGLRGNKARDAAYQARRKMRDERWREIVRGARRGAGQVMPWNPEEASASVSRRAVAPEDGND
jgi:hypothetical protein